MAVDSAILEAMGNKKARPTLRLYAWDPPCLSLGYAQPVSDVDQSKLNATGWGLVRRPTGGRAILHADELTYAVIGPKDEPRLTGSVLESYRRLSQALLTALKALSVPVQAIPKAKSNIDREQPICFECPSDYEITVNGKKLIGSAQARKKAGVLQHGTLPLYGDLTRITQALSFPTEEKRSLAAAHLLEKATTVERVLGYRVSWESAARAFAQAFQETLNIEFIFKELTPDEEQRARELVKEKYSHSEWTEKRVRD